MNNGFELAAFGRPQAFQLYAFIFATAVVDVRRAGNDADISMILLIDFGIQILAMGLHAALDVRYTAGAEHRHFKLHFASPTSC